MLRRTLEEVKELVTARDYALIDYYIYGKRKISRVIIQNSIGYKYDLELGSFLGYKRGASFVEKRNPFTLENISLWLRLNDKKFFLADDNVYVNATQRLKFYHSVCNEMFYSSWETIYRGDGCSVCSGHQVGKRTSLAYLRADLAKEWHSDNELNPEDVTCNSHKMIYWICSNCGYGKNKEWRAMVGDRSKGPGCPSCSRSPKVVTDKNRLSIKNKSLSDEWHPTKNGDLTPNDVSYGMDRKVWWLCGNGHSYESRISDRNRGTGCPICNQSGGEQKINKILNSYEIVNCSEYKELKDCRDKGVLSFDFYLSDYNFCIEYHGPQHYEPVEFFGGEKEFKERRKRDKIKVKYCKDNNISLLIIPYWEFDNIEEILERTFFE